MSEQPKVVNLEAGADLVQLMDQCKSFAQFKQLDDIQQKCLDWTKQFLGRKWTHLTVDDVEIEQLMSGMSGQVYRCKAINWSTEDNDVQEVAIKLYGLTNRIDFKTLGIISNGIEEGITSLISSQMSVGPQIYGLFETGLVMKYYQHRHFKEADLYNPQLLEQLASKLAQFHAMKSPLPKTSCKLNDFLQTLSRVMDEKRELYLQYDCKTLLECDLRAELEWVLNIMENIESPLVFTHFDFRFGNTMVVENNKIILSDFEVSGYFKRGYDFASFFFPMICFEQNSFEFKDESVVKEFIGFYIKENEKLFGKQYSENKYNSVDQILMETKIILIYHLAFTVYCLLNNEVFQMPITQKTCFTIANSELNTFLNIKKHLKVYLEH